MVVFWPRRGLEHRQVAASARLGVADGEHDFASGDAGQKALLLQCTAMGNQRRANCADGHERQRCAGNVGFFKEDQLLGGRVALATVFLGPAHGQPAITAHLPNGLAKQLAAFLAA
ncbi:hypothetical protein D3C78_1134420 [compost metagenome]